jgi:putative membrane protein
MKSSPFYRDLPETDLILRDVLAVDRTILANERTFLAYIRTALAFLITGVGLVKFFDSIVVNGFGWFLMLVTALTFLHGARRFNGTKQALLIFQKSSRENLGPKTGDT